MKPLQTTTLTAQDISTPLAVATYTAIDNRELTVHVYLSGLTGNGTYRACLTKQRAGIGTHFQSPTSAISISNGSTTAWLEALSISVTDGDIIKIWIQGLVNDENVNIITDIFDAAAPTVTEICNEIDTNSISIQAIKAKTDQLDVSAVTQVTTNLLGHLVITAGNTYTTEITGLTIPVNWEKVYWTVKQNPEDIDNSSIIQLVISNPDDNDDGVLRLNSALPPTGLEQDGFLEINQVNGTVSINLSDELTVLLKKAGGRDTTIRSLGWDLKFIDSNGIGTGIRGTAAIVLTETKATS